MTSAKPNKYVSLGNPGRPSRQAVYERLQIQIGELRVTALEGCRRRSRRRRIWRGVWLEEAHHSTAIEGNTLVLQQVRSCWRKGVRSATRNCANTWRCRATAARPNGCTAMASSRAPGRPTNRSASPTSATSTGSRWISSAGCLPHPQAGDSEAPGSFRQHEHRVISGRDEAAAVARGPDGMAGWIARRRRCERVGPLLLPEELARLRAHFEQIHPFLDGNEAHRPVGAQLAARAARVSPAIIYKRERAQYLRALRRDRQRGLRFTRRTARAGGARQSLQVRCSGGGRTARLVPLPALATDGVSVDALRVAARPGAARSDQGRGRHVAQLSAVGRRLSSRPNEEGPAGARRLTSNANRPPRESGSGPALARLRAAAFGARPRRRAPRAAPPARGSSRPASAGRGRPRR